MAKVSKSTSGNIHSALIRGLSILRKVSEAGQAVRFSDLRATLPGIQDSTLTRLLQTLEAAGYLRREGRKGYIAGEELEQWLGSLQLQVRHPAQMFHQTVLDLVTRTNESAAIAILEGDRLAVVSSQTAPGAVSIIESGQTLHFESDHAGSLLVLSEMGRSARRALLESSFSRMQNEEIFQASLQALEMNHSVGVDRSVARPGICRLAIAFQSGQTRGSVFLCLTEARARQDLDRLCGVLVELRDRLEKMLQVESQE